MLGSPILYLKGMRIMMFQLSGFYCKVVTVSQTSACGIHKQKGPRKDLRPPVLPKVRFAYALRFPEEPSTLEPRSSNAGLGFLLRNSLYVTIIGIKNMPYLMLRNSL